MILKDNIIDLSAAFDRHMSDHEILLQWLRDLIEIQNQALAWIRYYLSDKLQRVNIKRTLSDMQKLSFGVPQGSVIWPIMYCLYTKPVFDIIQRFGLLYHTYLYVAIEEKYYFTDKLSDIENCESEGKL